MVQIGSRCRPTLRKNQTPRASSTSLPADQKARGRARAQRHREPDSFGSARDEAGKQNMRGGLNPGDFIERVSPFQSRFRFSGTSGNPS